MADVMRLAAGDNVKFALRPLRAGESVVLDGVALSIDGDVAIGHKVAACEIAPGDTIVKYNRPIGIATQAIAAGSWVRTHTVKSGPGHYWPYALVPLYALARMFPPTREPAVRLGLVTLAQIVTSLVAAVETPPRAGGKIVDVLARARAELPD